MAIKSNLLLFTIIIMVPLIDFSLCDDLNKDYLRKIFTEDEFEKIIYVGRSPYLPSRGILRLKYYLLDPIHALYIQN